jgi:hypothetical protein
MHIRHNRNKIRGILLILILQVMFWGLLPMINANTDITLKFKRNVGTDMGDGRIEGDWTITGTGGSSIVRLALQFNGTNVSTIEGHALTFRFKTEDYGIGMMNITLIGWDISGMVNQTTQLREFLDPAFTEAFLWIILSIVGGVFGLILIIAVIKRVRQKKIPPPQKDDIKIEEI